MMDNYSIDADTLSNILTSSVNQIIFIILRYFTKEAAHGENI